MMQLLANETYRNEYSEDFVSNWDDLIGWDGREEGEASFFERILKAYDVEHVADIACGTGFHTVKLAQAGFSVTASDGDGNVTTGTRSYTVVDGSPPAVRILTPPPGAVYDRGEQVAVDVACEDEAGGSGVATCRANADGGLLDTNRSGYHLVVLVGVDGAGNTAVAVRGYTVRDQAGPTITVRLWRWA